VLNFAANASGKKSVERKKGFCGVCVIIGRLDWKENGEKFSVVIKKCYKQMSDY
jgi:hypothetical protein